MIILASYVLVERTTLNYIYIRNIVHIGLYILAIDALMYVMYVIIIIKYI